MVAKQGREVAWHREWLGFGSTHGLLQVIVYCLTGISKRVEGCNVFQPLSLPHLPLDFSFASFSNSIPTSAFIVLQSTS